MLEEFQEFIDKRLNDIPLGLDKKDDNYQKLEMALLKRQDKFINKADEELQRLVVEYGDIINAQMAIYIQGNVYLCFIIL
ncbi:hypothetical protein [Clostridium kluyveri]|uniref:Uncharacterized protein n=1 Tax=Clostridium kluyveri TaxID=1534 RepID=A0A1L5FCY9_CLOKL|nr:hypothetical protein [Clostridium kluyveri]APM40882.1 hypothetical protein BS101_20305 [Clostridium kluyveri]UZQ48973.1 hypothetical protein OP486_13400 [Clostridium kluyveri]